MIKIVKLFFLLFPLALTAQEQVLVFKHPTGNREIVVKPGQTLSIQYSGYRGQTEYFKQMVTAINDSVITLGYPVRTPFFTTIDPTKTGEKQIRISDITRFRRITQGRQLLKSLATTTVAVGSFLAFFKLNLSGKYSGAQSLLIAFGITTGSMLLVEVMLPENPKYQLADGWTVQVVRLP